MLVVEAAETLGIADSVLGADGDFCNDDDVVDDDVGGGDVGGGDVGNGGAAGEIGNDGDAGEIGDVASAAEAGGGVATGVDGDIAKDGAGDAGDIAKDGADAGDIAKDGAGVDGGDVGSAADILVAFAIACADDGEVTASGSSRSTSLE